ncbi:fimbrial protein [Burkholderia sp. PU8-34]
MIEGKGMMEWQQMKSKARARTQGRFAAVLARAIAGVLLAAISGGVAHAALATCIPSSSGGLARLPESLKISSDAPINSVLWRQTGIQISATCKKVLPVPGTAAVAATLYRWMDDPKLIANGLALFVTYNGNRGHGLASFPMAQSIAPWGETTVKATVDLELVKIGPTPSVPTDFPVLSVLSVLIGGSDMAYSDSARFITLGFDKISFQPTTCTTTTPSVYVDLGANKLSTSSGLGSGMGSTSAAKGFSIGLRCDTGVAGNFGVSLMLDGNSVDASNGVLSLSSSSTAKGVGIQLLRSDNLPVPIGTPWKVGDLASSSSLSVPLAARYMQTGASARPGTANGSATFTIIYK